MSSFLTSTKNDVTDVRVAYFSQWVRTSVSLNREFMLYALLCGVLIVNSSFSAQAFRTIF